MKSPVIIVNPDAEHVEAIIRRDFAPNQHFTIDSLPIKFTDSHAAGAVMQHLKRRKVIADTHRVKVARNPLSRGSKVTVWRVRPVGAKR